MRLVRRAAPRELAVSATLQLANGAGVAVQLLLGRRLLGDILRADRLDLGLSDVLPSLIAFLAVTGVLGFANSAGSELQRLISELVGVGVSATRDEDELLLIPPGAQRATHGPPRLLG